MKIDIQERRERAMAYFRQGYNCCQSVVLAFEDIIGMDREALLKLSIGLGGGVGRMREVCGTVSAMAMLSGCLTEGKADDSADEKQQIHARKAECYKLVQQLADKFREENGSIVCRELLQGRIAASKSPIPEERTEHYYKARPCEQLVGCSAGIIAEYLCGNLSSIQKPSISVI